MTTYVFRDGRLVEKRHAIPAPRIHVVSDAAEFRSQFDGAIYTSKRRYRAELRARGLIEVGNERAAFEPRPFEPPSAVADIKAAIETARRR